MLSWLRRRRDQAERIEAEADALISDLGDGAYRKLGAASARRAVTKWSGSGAKSLSRSRARQADELDSTPPPRW